METTIELRRRIAFLESRLDQVESEYSYLNGILIDCGFPGGVSSLKATVEDLLTEGSEDISSFLDEEPPHYNVQ